MFNNLDKRFLLPLVITSLPLLLLSGCSPLRLLNNISQENENVTILQKIYGTSERQRFDLYMPENAVANSPVVVFFYGGSWKSGEKGKYGFVGHTLSSKGYVTVIPDYRLYPEVKFPDFVDDGARVIAWVRNNLDQAENGVVVMGHSAGAHTAALLALDKTYLEKQEVPHTIVRGMIGLAGPYGFNPMKYRSTRPIFAGTEPIDKARPVTFACASTAPILLMHGESDTVVIPQNSRELKQSVEKCGGLVEYLELAEMGHFSIILGLSDSFLKNNTILVQIDDFLKSLSSQTPSLARSN